MSGNSSEALRYCIIHGHFYQPPRENPWIDIIETQASAAPAHDWNERVFDECYRPNAYSRLLDERGMISAIHNNYRNLSFNFGPTLFRWLEGTHPDVAERIVAADRESCSRFEGHGNALAQVYNHIIMPLASRRDQLTQIRWAVSFFRERFGREPEGMWLSETAINMETLVCLVEEGIRFIVLSPGQAEAARGMEQGEKWEPVEKQPLDTRRPYRLFPYTKQEQRGEGSVDVFFFDERLAKEASFGGLLDDANEFARSLAATLDEKAGEPQVAVVATDGETFGHHKPFADMCLSFFFRHAAQAHGIIPVNFGYYLAKNPPKHEVRLKNMFDGGTSWSCAHGTGRWMRDCGCRTGGAPSWNQAWRGPLRSALQALQDAVDKAYEEFFAGFVDDPWRLRDDYGRVMQRGEYAELGEILAQHGAVQPVEREKLRRAEDLLEAQKYMQFSFTSCAWFFADIGGLEAVQNMRYACRALQLGIAGGARDEALGNLLGTLDTAKGNVGGQTGRSVFEQQVLPQVRYREILCFTTVVDKVVSGSDAREFSRFGHAIAVRRLDQVAKRQTDAFVVCVTDTRTHEKADFSVLIRHGYSARTIGYVLPFDIEREHAFDPANLKRWTADKRCVKLGLGDIFVEPRSIITGHFVKQIAKSTTARYLSWMRSNEKVLGALAGLNGSLPSFLQGPVAYLLTNEWNAAIALLREPDTEEHVQLSLLDLSRRARTYGVALDLSMSTAVLEELLGDEMERLSHDLSTRSCDRMRYLLNIVDRFSLPLAKHRLEDTFYGVLHGPIRALYDEYAASAGQPSDKAAFLASLLGFARRMNFGTSEFSLR